MGSLGARQLSARRAALQRSVGISGPVAEPWLPCLPGHACGWPRFVQTAAIKLLRSCLPPCLPAVVVAALAFFALRPNKGWLRTATTPLPVPGKPTDARTLPTPSLPSTEGTSQIQQDSILPPGAASLPSTYLSNERMAGATTATVSSLGYTSPTSGAGTASGGSDATRWVGAAGSLA